MNWSSIYKVSKKNKNDPVSHTFGLNLYFKKCHIFEYIWSNEQLSLGVPIKPSIQNQKGNLFWIPFTTIF